MKVGCSLIGTPAGFEELPAKLNKDLDLAHIIDFPNRELSIFPGSEIFKFTRIVIDGIIYNVFSYYRFAIEATNIRPGSYYGSSVTLKNSEADGGYIVQVLRDMANIVRDECIGDNNRFIKRISDIQNISIPSSLETLEKSCVDIKRLENYLKVQGQERLFCKYKSNDSNLFELVEWCHEIYLYNDVDTVFFSSSEEVEKSAIAKGYLKVVEPERLKEVIKDNKDEHNKILKPQKKNKDKKNQKGKEISSNDRTPSEVSITEPIVKSHFTNYSEETTSGNYEVERKRRNLYWFLITENRAKIIALLFFVFGVMLGLLTSYSFRIYKNEYAQGGESKTERTYQERDKNDTSQTTAVSTVITDTYSKKTPEEIKTNIVTPATPSSPCEWSVNSSLWQYKGTNLQNTKELSSAIVKFCGKKECQVWESKVDSILKVFNKHHINKSTGKIDTFGLIVFRIPQDVTINVSGFVKIK